MNKSSCVNCKYFYFSGAEPGYSEMTPGSDMVLNCEKDHWDTQRRSKKVFWVDNQDDFRKAMAMSKTCKDFEGVE